ncbi:MAG: DnaJ domain-containing protein [Rubrivivax sp.]
MTTERRNLYRILQVQPEAPDEVLKASYRALIGGAKGQHPDRGGDAERAAMLNHAYAVLSDPDRRHAYDRSLDRPRPIGPAAPPPEQPLGRAASLTACAFCGTPVPHASAEDCDICDSPLQPPPALGAGAATSTFEETGVGELADPRRREARVSRTDRARMQLPGETGEVIVHIDDLSFGGIGLAAGRPVREGTPIRLRAVGFDAVVLVLRCRRDGADFALHGRLLTMRMRRSAGTFVSTRV